MLRPGDATLFTTFSPHSVEALPHWASLIDSIIGTPGGVDITAHYRNSVISIDLVVRSRERPHWLELGVRWDVTLYELAQLRVCLRCGEPASWTLMPEYGEYEEYDDELYKEEGVLCEDDLDPITFCEDCAPSHGDFIPLTNSPRSGEANCYDNVHSWQGGPCRSMRSGSRGLGRLGRGIRWARLALCRTAAWRC